MQKITKIVITGGPCAGKTTAMSWIQNAFTERGYKVLFVPETATELITGGVTPWDCKTNLDYQRCQIKLQITKEKLFVQASKTMANDKILIVCDRGLLDNKAYMNDEDFNLIAQEMNSNEIEFRDNYDAVFHLVSAAKGAEKFYTIANNSARTESIEEAAILDDKLINAWTGHPHYRIIDNSDSFENKMKKLITELSLFLGEPLPYKIERKFLIEYPDINYLINNLHAKEIDITQTYLKTKNDEEVRIRQRGYNGDYIYYQTIKKDINNYKRIEIEKRLSKNQYLKLLDTKDKIQLTKKRYCLTYKNLYFEVDIFPFWNDKAIVEIEITDLNDEVTLPDTFKVIKEVTDDIEYRNYTLANKNN